jgi:hypothetical protein
LNEAAEVYASIVEGDHGVPVPNLSSDLGVRRTPLARFPFWIVFVEDDNQVVIVAYAHERRRPGYWAKRVRR